MVSRQRANRDTEGRAFSRPRGEPTAFTRGAPTNAAVAKCGASRTAPHGRVATYGQVAALSGSKGWVDGTVGARARYGFARRWHLTGKADVGTGGSDFTWQAPGGGGIDVGACCTALAAYRHLDTDYESDDFVYDAYLSGPTLGFEARF